MDRRTWLKLAGSAATASLLPAPGWAQALNPNMQPLFSEDELDTMARNLAAKSYVAPDNSHIDDALKSITYDQYRDIRFKAENAIWREDSLPFRLEMFQAAGNYYSYPVDINTVDAGRAQLIPYSPKLFNFGPLVKAPAENSQSGFAGLKARAPINDPTIFDEFLVFLGASYFRAAASGQSFGLSARGLAINIGQNGGEEFPLFRSFWVARPKPGDASLTIYALLDSASSVGRFKFTATPGRDTVIETEAVFYPRKQIPYAGIAPMTSMFFFGPDAQAKRKDFRPRVHDSEALSVLNGYGEWIWRPVINPERLQFSVFLDKNPKGFGLIQRARNFAEYQDLEAQYERRPTLWIEPLDDWGEGSIDLIELPAQDEYHDNIVCFWRPKDGLSPGIGHRFRYRMHWCWEPPTKSNKPAVAQTRVGETRNGDALFIVDFSGTESCDPCKAGGLTCVPTASSGEIHDPVVMPNVRAGGYRLSFRYTPPGGNQTADLRAILLVDNKPVSETWIFRWAR